MLVCAAVYWPVGLADFLSVDDHEYVSQNQTVQAGLTASGLRWAFDGVHVANYHPLTWLSHMLDNQLFGPKPGPQHLVNLLFHAINSVLVFVVFQRMTGHTWASAFLGGLFALHPEHVESVAWIAERKDVLSAMFWLLTMWAYAAYVERPRWWRYALALLLFAAGLLSKPMVVTLPCVLLLMDCWPLKRQERWRELIVEKIPFFALSVGSCVLTVLAQARGGAVSSLEQLPLWYRLGNVVVAYFRYIRKFLWPTDLAAFYPLMRPWPRAYVIASVAGLLLITALVLLLAKKRPYLTVGWLWFVGTLIPVIGLVQVGIQSMADRYMYLPMIGLAVMITWAVVEGMPRRVHAIAGVLGVMLLCGAGYVTAKEVPYWHDSEPLFTRALDRTEPNVFTLLSLASAKVLNGNIDSAIADYRTCVRMQPHNPHVRRAFGYALREAKRYDEAHEQLKRSLSINPNDGRSWEAMARLYADEKKWPEAAEHYAAAAELRPDDFSIRTALSAAHYESGDREAALADLRAAEAINPSSPQPWRMAGVLLIELNRPDEAAQSLHRAIELEPDNADTYYRLGVALMNCGRGTAAVAPLMTAVKLAPTSPEPLYHLAWLLATHPDAKVRSGPDALFLANRAAELTKEHSPDALDALAAAQAEQRQFDDAAETAARAAKLAREAGKASLADQITARAERYRAGRAVRDQSLTSADAAASAVP